MNGVWLGVDIRTKIKMTRSFERDQLELNYILDDSNSQSDVHQIAKLDKYGSWRT